MKKLKRRLLIAFLAVALMIPPVSVLSIGPIYSAQIRLGWPSDRSVKIYTRPEPFFFVYGLYVVWWVRMGLEDEELNELFEVRQKMRVERNG